MIIRASGGEQIYFAYFIYLFLIEWSGILEVNFLLILFIRPSRVVFKNSTFEDVRTNFSDNSEDVFHRLGRWIWLE